MFSIVTSCPKKSQSNLGNLENGYKSILMIIILNFLLTSVQLWKNHRKALWNCLSCLKKQATNFIFKLSFPLKVFLQIDTLKSQKKIAGKLPE